jgi:hypothetical protein
VRPHPISVRKPSYDELSAFDKPPSTHDLRRRSRTSTCTFARPLTPSGGVYAGVWQPSVLVPLLAVSPSQRPSDAVAYQYEMSLCSSWAACAWRDRLSTEARRHISLQSVVGGRWSVLCAPHVSYASRPTAGGRERTRHGLQDKAAYPTRGVRRASKVNCVDVYRRDRRTRSEAL